MTSKEALKKLDHTICLNQNDNRLKFGYGKELNETCDCETFEEAVECIETIEKDLDKLEQHKKIEQELGVDLITLFKFNKKWLKHIRIGTDIVDESLSAGSCKRENTCR